MPRFAEILDKIANPVPQVLKYLEAFNSQLNLSLADVDRSDENVFGTVTAARRNYKPFIIGFIPPDNVINYIPIAVNKTAVGNVNAKINVATGGSIDDRELITVPNTVRYTSGNAGKIPRRRIAVNVDELRQKVYDSYIKQSGRAPTEQSLKFIVSHIFTENGFASSTNYITTTCYNLGLSEANGKGTYEKGKDTKAYRDSHPDPLDGAVGLGEPRSGTSFLSVGYTGDNVAYPVWYQGFVDLDSAVDFQVNLLLREGGYPRAANALTIDEYLDGLLDPQNGRAPYFTANKEFYKRRLSIQVANYEARWGDQPLGESVIVGSPKTIENISDDNPRAIMKYGEIGYEADPDDPLGNRFGRNIRYADYERRIVVQQQVDALRQQVDLIKQIPPLIMLINPKNFDRSYEISTDYGPKTRYGHIVHNWLEMPTDISCSGVTAGQYIIDAEGSGGLTHIYRVHSISYANLLSLVLIYKNNGRIFAGYEAERGIPILAFTVFIYYDDHIYLGSFDNFSVDDSVEPSPYNLEYDFKFKVRYDIDVESNVPDYLIVSNLGF